MADVYLAAGVGYMIADQDLDHDGGRLHTFLMAARSRCGVTAPCLCTANVVPFHTGFSEAKPTVVAALREGNFEHEAHEALAEKNLLAVGDVDANEVAAFIEQGTEMKILREGDRGYALAPERGRVKIVYEYRTVQLEKSKATVSNVLVGVDTETGEVLTVPAQSTPKLKAAREAKKREVMSVRMPRELDDVLHLVADRYRVASRQFAPAVIRYYLTLACANADMAQRLSTLSKSRLATGRCQKDLRLRIQRELVVRLRDIAVVTEGATRSDMVRGAIVAAKEDVLDDGARERQRQLEAIARAV